MRYTVYANTGRTGWQAMRSFTSPADADQWLAHLIKSHGYSMTDFTIKREQNRRAKA